MDSLVNAVEAADSGWAVAAIAIIGLYVLAWRFGAQILRTVLENNEVAKSAHGIAEDVQTSIVTNHGSKNIGDAVDLLTEAVAIMQDQLTSSHNATQEMRNDFNAHLLLAERRDLSIAKAARQIAKIEKRNRKKDGATD